MVDHNKGDFDKLWRRARRGTRNRRIALAVVLVLVLAALILAPVLHLV